MKLEGVLPFARSLLRTFCGTGDLVVDGTAGNGHDTLFLSNLVGENGHVYAFDVQETAINASKTRLAEHGEYANVTFYHDSHEHMLKRLPSSVSGKVAASIFNLGYLPGSDKSVTTSGDSTINAIEQLLSILKKNGVIVLVIYHGHEEGKKEKQLVMDYVTSLPQEKAYVLRYDFINQRNDPPFIVAIEKRG